MAPGRGLGVFAHKGELRPHSCGSGNKGLRSAASVLKGHRFATLGSDIIQTSTGKQEAGPARQVQIVSMG